MKGTQKIHTKKICLKKSQIVGYDIKWKMPKGSNLTIENFYKKNLVEISKKVIRKTKKNFNKF